MSERARRVVAAAVLAMSVTVGLGVVTTSPAGATPRDNVNTLTNVLKSKHDAAMAAIQNTR